MCFSWEVFRSVEDVWAVWLLGAAVLGWLTARAARRRRWRQFAGFLADERGASYALPYVLTFPVYMLLICVIIQATMILLVKMDTVYAAYAAARAAVVWRSAEPDAANDQQAYEFAKGRARRAAALAMVPVASSLKQHYAANAPYRASQALGRASEVLGLAPHYYGAYKKMHGCNVQRDGSQKPPTWIIPAEEADKPARWQYVFNKLRYAFLATDVDLTMEKNEFNADLTAEIRYLMPMHIPFAGRVLGTWWAWDRFYSRWITSVATLPLETPLSENKRLGIPYASRSD